MFVQRIVENNKVDLIILFSPSDCNNNTYIIDLPQSHYYIALRIDDNKMSNKQLQLYPIALGLDTDSKSRQILVAILYLGMKQIGTRELGWTNPSWMLMMIPEYHCHHPRADISFTKGQIFRVAEECLLPLSRCINFGDERLKRWCNTYLLRISL